MDLSEMIKGDQLTLLNFHATWCGPCHVMKPNLEKVRDKFGEKIFYGRIDIDQHREIAEIFQIRSVPTTILIKGGEIKWRQSGVIPDSEISRLVEENL